MLKSDNSSSKQITKNQIALAKSNYSKIRDREENKSALSKSNRKLVASK